MEIEVYELLLPLAVILFLSKFLGLTAQKIGMPAVIGMLLSGIIISFLQYIPGVVPGNILYELFFSTQLKEGYQFLAKIGVVLIMFSAGMGTNMKEIKQTGKAAMVITTLGVVVPMLLGFGVAVLFDYYTDINLVAGGNGGTIGEVNILSDAFYGAILTATSVSITVATLKELGKLNTKYGTAIVSAAVIDDIIGVIILSVLTGLNSSAEGSSNTIGTWFNPGSVLVCIKIVLFFVFALGFGFVVRQFFRKLGNNYEHHRRLPIFAIAVGFFYAYIAEKIFGVADITGAFIAGILLSNLNDTYYEEQKVDNLGYLLFTPIFFANIGISNISFSAFGGIWLAFGACYIIAALIGKFVGCGIGGLVCKFNKSDSAKIGAGMMVRAEVVLVCSQKGIDSGLVSGDVLTYVCVIIIITSLISPMLIKKLVRKDDENIKAIDN